MLAHCSPSSKWVPGGNTGEIKAARKGAGHPTLLRENTQDKCTQERTLILSVLSNRHFLTYESIRDYLYLNLLYIYMNLPLVV